MDTGFLLLQCDNCQLTESDDPAALPSFTEWDPQKIDSLCMTCPIILSGLVQYLERNEDNLESSKVQIARNWWGPQNGSLLCNVLDGRDSQVLYALEFFVPFGCPTHDLESVFGFARGVWASDPGLNIRPRITREWLSKCLHNHNHCTRIAPPDAELPTRLLDVAGFRSTGEVRLVETRTSSGEGLRGRYACLSHCWGQSRPLQTTKANLGLMKEGIAWSSIPRTFQDAILVIDHLKIRYIWIDSLCIVQDVKSDWEVESARMGEIYGRSLITIHASRAKDANAGFLRWPNREEPCIVFEAPGKYEPDRTFTVAIRATLSHNQWKKSHIAANDDGGEHEVDDQDEVLPLHRRAWASQEYILAPRSVQFGTHEMVWECGESMTCECSSGFPPEFASFLAPTFDNPYGRQPRDFRTKRHVRDTISGIENGSRSIPGLSIYDGFRVQPYAIFFTFWSDLVSAYTRRALTLEKDRLPAISGIARQAMDSTPLPLHYYAGHWLAAEDLSGKGPMGSGPVVQFLSSLCWTPNSCSARRIVPYRAPSWSWASIEDEAGLTFMDPRTENLMHRDSRDRARKLREGRGLLFTRVEACCALQKINCETVGLDRTGAVADGFLQIRSRYIDALLKPDTEPEGRSRYIKDVGSDFRFDIDDCNTSLEGGTPILLVPLLVEERYSVNHQEGSRRFHQLIRSANSLGSLMNLIKRISTSPRTSDPERADHIATEHRVFILVCRRHSRGPSFYSRIGLLMVEEEVFRDAFGLPFHWRQLSPPLGTAVGQPEGGHPTDMGGDRCDTTIPRPHVSLDKRSSVTSVPAITSSQPPSTESILGKHRDSAGVAVRENIQAEFSGLDKLGAKSSDPVLSSQLSNTQKFLAANSVAQRAQETGAEMADSSAWWDNEAEDIIIL